MPKHRTAESVLTWFTSRERAATIIGDLQEAGGVQWVVVIRLSIALLWADIRSAPFRSLSAFAIGWALCMVALAVIAPMLMGALGWAHADYSERELIWFVSAVLWGRILAPFAIGSIVTRLTPGRTLTICVLVAVFGEAMLLAYWFQAMLAGHPSPVARELFWLNLLPPVPLLAGAIRLRERALRQVS